MKEGNLAIVEGVGYVDSNLSHFRSQDIHHSGINRSDPKVKLLSGWLGRYFEQLLPNFPMEIPEHLLIDIFNVLENRYKKVYSGFYSAGIHQIPVNILISSNYVCSIIVNQRRYTKNFVVVK